MLGAEKKRMSDVKKTGALNRAENARGKSQSEPEFDHAWVLLETAAHQGRERRRVQRVSRRLE
jgi:hypothetical protein